MKNKISREECRKIQMNILLVLDDICKRNDLNYYLGYGSMLGAVRHKGYIPWDDDIDICLFREDYDKLIKILKEQQEINWLDIVDSSVGEYYYPFAKATDNRTIAKMEDNITPHGIWVDIFPIDNVPNSKYRSKIYIYNCYLLRAMTIAMTTDFSEVKNVKKIYTTRFGGNQVQALSNINFTVEKGEYVAIMGESGSGKTTLLNILAALDKPTSGEVLLNGKNLVSVKEKEISAFRRDHLGFVFQDFNLLDNFSLKDNIFLPLVLSGVDYKEMEKRIRPIAQKLEITELLEKYPYEVSGGQKQRAAVARALITNPELVLADEPTGALDSRATDGLLKLFSQINAEGQTIVMVTHSTKAASHANRILFIKDGEVFHQIYRGNATNEQLYVKISDALTVLTTGGEEHE